MNPIDADYQDVLLLPPSVEDWVPSDHPARFIREVVEQIDIGGVTACDGPSDNGRPPYSKRLLLRVWLMGYWRGLRSTRKLEQACRESLPFVWLCGNHPPDHTTLWRFFTANKKHLGNFFRQTVLLAKEMNLMDFVLQAVDGTKVKAACSSYQRTDKEALQKLLSRLDSHIVELEAAFCAGNDRERVADGNLPKELSDRRRLRKRVAEALEQLKSAKVRHCHPQDLQARRMQCNEGNQFAYNAQAVVESKSQIVIAAEVTNKVSDTECLCPMIEAAEANTGRRSHLTLADRGYSAAAQLAKAEESGHDVLAPLCGNAEKGTDKPFHASKFAYNPVADVVTCPQGQQLRYHRTRRKRTVTSRYYRNVRACASCPGRDRCTTSPHGRDIEIRVGHEQVEKLRTRLQDPAAQALLRRRCVIVEPVFAQIKTNGNFKRWTMHGLTNARAQWFMLCSVWNLRKVYHAWRRKLRPFFVLACRARRAPNAVHTLQSALLA